MSVITSSTVALALGIVISISEARAQSEPSPECQSAMTTLTEGTITQLDSQTLARAIIPACGANGRIAVAQAMTRYRTITDDNAVRMMFRPNVADSAILRAALDPASGHGASVPVRVASFGMLLRFEDPSAYLSLGELRSVHEGESCEAGTGLEMSSLDTTAIPATADESIRALSIGVERDSSEPIEVRSAANCVANAWRVKHQYPPQVLTTIPASAVRLDYWCGARFRILSSLPVALTLQYGSMDGPRSDISVPPKTQGDQDSVTLFDAHASDTISLFLDGTVLATATSTGVACR